MLYFAVMTAEYWMAFFFIAAAAFLAAIFRKLNLAGAVAGFVVGSLVFLSAHYAGILMLGAFFVLGTAATSWKMNVKEQLKAAEKNKGRRNAAQVLANGGIAVITGLLILIYPDEKMLFLLMMAASLASATADTLSSELGTLYGTRFYNVLTFKKDRRGENGVISLEGTLFGMVGSAVIALIYAVSYGWNANFYCIVLAGTIGNLSDSILGATLERKGYLNNDAVNFLNTLLAALAAWAMAAR
jgi:uncharacterized protein (TIGR00297 family)